MKILVYRFSAMGDVALCLPVLKMVLALNPQVEITFVTRKAFAFLFEGIPRIKVIVADFEKNHKGFWGLVKLSQEITLKTSFDYIGDLHQVLRSHVLNFLLRKIPQSKIKKDRKGKKQFQQSPTSQYLKHTTQRYCEVFQAMGLRVTANPQELIQYGYDRIFSSPKVHELLKNYEGKKILGIAPFARHFTKIWPLEYIEDLLRLLQDKPNLVVMLFGGPEDEKLLAPLARRFSNVINLAGIYSLEEELELMKKTEVMLTMDSANMHFAFLCNVPVVSLWGGTHPGFGFYPLDSRSKILQVDTDSLSCRPCALFGKSSCPKGHFRCMYDIKPDIVVSALTSFI